MTDTVQYAIQSEERARNGWYILNRDRFLLQALHKHARLAARSPLRVLDAACGTGGFVALARSRDLLCTGTDRSASSVRWGRATGRLPATAIADICHLPFAADSFDFVVASEVLEHVDDDDLALSELLRVARHGVLVTVPAHGYLWTDSDTILLHKRRYSRGNLTELIRRHRGRAPSVHAFGAMPGLMIAAYKVLRSIRVAVSSKRAGRTPREEAKPLASRVSVPRVVDGLRALLFRQECRLALKGWLPWGNTYWVFLDTALEPSVPNR